jgi:hypothetical protein
MRPTGIQARLRKGQGFNGGRLAYSLWDVNDNPSALDDYGRGLQKEVPMIPAALCSPLCSPSPIPQHMRYSEPGHSIKLQNCEMINFCCSKSINLGVNWKTKIVTHYGLCRLSFDSYVNTNSKVLSLLPEHREGNGALRRTA